LSVVLALGVVVDLDGGDAGVGGRDVEAGVARGREQLLAGADVDVVAAALQLLQAGDEREQVPGGGHDVGEDASHGESLGEGGGDEVGDR
jgi:hypothetical protein